MKEVMKSIGKGLLRGFIGGVWAMLGLINVILGIMLTVGGEDEEGDV